MKELPGLQPALGLHTIMVHDNVEYVEDVLVLPPGYTVE